MRFAVIAALLSTASAMKVRQDTTTMQTQATSTETTNEMKAQEDSTTASTSTVEADKPADLPTEPTTTQMTAATHEWDPKHCQEYKYDGGFNKSCNFEDTNGKRGWSEGAYNDSTYKSEWSEYKDPNVKDRVHMSSFGESRYKANQWVLDQIKNDKEQCQKGGYGDWHYEYCTKGANGWSRSWKGDGSADATGSFGVNVDGDYVNSWYSS